VETTAVSSIVDVVTTISHHGFADTVRLLRGAIEGGGGTVFAEIDQRVAASKVGLALRPTTLLVFGNPRGGTPLMEAHPLFALELPLKLLVWEEADVVSVAYVPMRIVAERYGIAGEAEKIGALDRTLAALVAKISG
jgi:uncharacterized protein (DUF302 family)